MRNLLLQFWDSYATHARTMAIVPLDGGAFTDVDVADEWIHKALVRTRHDGRYLNTLGIIRYRQGRWQDAIIELKRGLFLGMEGPESWLFLAMANWRLKEIDESRRWLEIAREWKSEHTPNLEQKLFYSEAEKLGL